MSGVVFGGYLFLLDMNTKNEFGNLVKYRYLQNMDTKLKTDIQDNNVTSQDDEYETVCGLELRLEKIHAAIKGLTNL